MKIKNKLLTIIKLMAMIIIFLSLPDAQASKNFKIKIKIKINNIEKKHGASADIVIKDEQREGYSYPILHLPFKIDMAKFLADEYFKQMVISNSPYDLVDDISKLTYLLDVSPSDINSKDEEIEALDIIELLTDLEFMGRFYFNLDELREKLNAISGMSEFASKKIAIKKYFLGIESLKNTHDLIVSSHKLIDDFLRWGKSNNFSPKYREKLTLLKQEIKKNIKKTFFNLNLNDKQQQEIGLIL